MVYLLLKNLLRIGVAVKTKKPVSMANGITLIQPTTGIKSVAAGLKCSWLRQTVWSFPTENGSQWMKVTSLRRKAIAG